MEERASRHVMLAHVTIATRLASQPVALCDRPPDWHRTSLTPLAGRPLPMNDLSGYPRVLLGDNSAAEFRSPHVNHMTLKLR